MARVVVIGHHPAYLLLAEKLGADAFSLPPDVWTAMSDAERWAANRDYLDRDRRRRGLHPRVAGGSAATKLFCARGRISYTGGLRRTAGIDALGDGSVMRRDISDPDWRAEVTALEALVAGRGRIVDESYDPIHFGNRIVDILYDGRRLRVVRDRGQLLTDIGDGAARHSLETVVAFGRGLAPAAAYDVIIDHDIASIVADNWDRIVASLDDPGLMAFETAVGQVFFDRLRSRAGHPVAAE